MVDFAAPLKGVASPTTVSYEPDYFFDHGAEGLADGVAVADGRAFSVRAPVDLEIHHHRDWPPYLLDLMPQGHARRRW